MQKQITTHKGDTLLLIEVPLDAMGIELISRLESAIVNEEHNDLWYYTKKSDDMIFVELPKNNYELIGTTSTLTDKDVEFFVEFVSGVNGIGYRDYLIKTMVTHKETALESFNSLLEVNNIDTNKNWVLLKLLNNG